MLRDLIRIARPHQYTKNLFIFAPAFFAFGMYDSATIFLTLLVFVAFSLLCSGVYCFNDIIDRRYDSMHPTKAKRPIASGAISVQVAIVYIAVLVCGGGALLMVSSYLYPYLTPLFTPISCYFVLNIAYSLWLKKIAIVDVFVIALGFDLRLWIGAICFGIALSHWIIIVTFLLALFLALAKRRDDVLLLENNGYKMRENIQSYNRTFIDVAMSISASLVMVAYIFYSIDEAVAERLHTDNLYFTSIFVLLGLFRYLQITFVQEASSSPSKVLLTDRFLQITIVAWIISFVWIVY